MVKRIALAIILFCLMAQVCPAPIYGGYPGLDKLIERSDAIAVVLLMKQKTSSSMGLYEEYEAHFSKMLKGEKPKDGVVTISVRHLPYGSSHWGFSSNTGYLLFLQQTGDKKVPYKSLNSEGAHWELPSAPDLKAIDALDAKGAIKHLLNQMLEYKRKELKTLEETVGKILKEEETQQPPERDK